ncbi:MULTISPECIES: DUF4190 domain-containing protein [Streptomyces]|uniref:DUF4190 domain-containing protein n=1 Tax=Streptomyces TaxID=1883 RepID=UPI00168A1FA8|nr:MULTISPECIES: DUF4190 domain-containing protein [Streptomyces]
MSAKSEDDAVPDAGGAEGAGAPQERDPWAPPAEDRSGSASPGGFSPGGVWPGGASGPVPPPGVPTGGAEGVGSPFAAPGEPVPPPPVSPDGPGQMPYAAPGQVPYGAPGQVPYGYPGQGYPGYQGSHGYPGYGWPAMPMAPANGMGVTALVLGIIAAAGFCLWPLAIVLGILAVIFGAVGRGKARRGEATNGGQALAGIICGAAGIVLGVALLVVLIVVPDEDPDAGSTRDDDPGYSAAAAPSAVGPGLTLRT